MADLIARDCCCILLARQYLHYLVRTLLTDTHNYIEQVYYFRDAVFSGSACEDNGTRVQLPRSSSIFKKQVARVTWKST